MNEDAKTMLEDILAKDVAQLNGEERNFLFARRSYLNEEQTKRFSALFKEMGAKADGDDGDDGDGLDALKKPQLEALAEKNDVDLSGASTNSDRVEALRKAGVKAQLFKKYNLAKPLKDGTAQNHNEYRNTRANSRRGNANNTSS